jgi:hypothetical protein
VNSVALVEEVVEEEVQYSSIQPPIILSITFSVHTSYMQIESLSHLLS